MKYVIIVLFTLINCSKDNGESEAKIQISHLRKNSVFNSSFYEINKKSSIEERIKPAPDSLLNFLGQIDKRIYSNYELNSFERTLIKESVDLLPQFIKADFQENLLSIFVVSENFLGSGMTFMTYDNNDKFSYVILLNAITLKLNMSEWLTYKENLCYNAKTSDIIVNINAGTKYSGVLGILLHESAHAIDYSNGFTPYLDNRHYYSLKAMGMDIKPIKSFLHWANIYELTDPLMFQWKDKVSFYRVEGEAFLAKDDAVRVYKDLQKTNFTSLYSSLSWAEELAEYFLFYHLTEKLNQPYKIYVTNKSDELFSYEPMKNPNLNNRFGEIISKIYSTVDKKPETN